MSPKSPFSLHTEDMGGRFLSWFDEGHWTAHGEVFDIGNTTRSALTRIREGFPADQAGGTSESDNGNGSLMRILPVSLAVLDEPDPVLVDRLERASAITHGHARSRMACVFHGLFVRALMGGESPADGLETARGQFRACYAAADELPAFRLLLDGDLREAPPSVISSGGYVLDTLVASLWCLLNTDCFEACVLRAVNLGGDTDTTGCVAGGLAGIVHGEEAIPWEWRDALPRPEDHRPLFGRFLERFAPGR